MNVAGKFESTNLSRDYLSREIGRTYYSASKHDLIALTIKSETE